jgi:hypothetical protein
MSEREYKLIEYPSMGATYCHQEYGVYEYGEYDDSSVLAGQVRRTFRDRYDTLEEAKQAHPDAEVCEGSAYQPVNVNHLPDDDGESMYQQPPNDWHD